MDNSTPSRPLVRIRGLRYSYPGGPEILRIPGLDVSGRGLIALTGPSGAGKSTLVELLAGTLHEGYEGEVEVLGEEWKDLRRDADRQRHLRRIGFIPQDFGLLPDRTPREMLEQDLRDGGVTPPEHAARIESALDQVGLADLADQRISSLSGGQGQRVAIARMLARDVDLVIADEPTANLDPGLRDTVMALLRKLSIHVPVLVVTHDAAVAESCDRTIILQAAASPSLGSAPTKSARANRRQRLVLGMAVLILAIAGGSAGLIASRSPKPPSAPTTQILEASLPLVACPTSVFPKSGAEHLLSHVTLSVPADLADRLAVYGDTQGVMQLVGPKGWQCSGDYGGDGSGGVEVFPPGELAPDGVAFTSQSQEAIAAHETSACLYCRLTQACPLFLSARAALASQYEMSCPDTKPAEEESKQLSNTVVEFEDPPGVAGDGNPSGGPYAANGVMTYVPGSPNGSWVETCTLPPSDHAICTVSLNAFVTRYHTTTEAATTSSTTSSTTTTATTTATTLPLPLVVPCGSDRSNVVAVFEPSKFVLACGDGAAYVKDITWSSWTATGAIGSGTLQTWDSETGTTDVPTSIVLSAPKVTPYCRLFCVGTPTTGLIFTSVYLSTPGYPASTIPG